MKKKKPQGKKCICRPGVLAMTCPIHGVYSPNAKECTCCKAHPPREPQPKCEMGCCYYDSTRRVWYQPPKEKKCGFVIVCSICGEQTIHGAPSLTMGNTLKEESPKEECHCSCHFAPKDHKGYRCCNDINEKKESWRDEFDKEFPAIEWFDSDEDTSYRERPKYIKAFIEKQIKEAKREERNRIVNILLTTPILDGKLKQILREEL